MEIIPSGGPLGAEVLGLRLGDRLGETEREAVRRAWNEHLVLVLRDQNGFGLDDHIAFSRQLGELALSPPSPVTGRRGEFEGVPPEVAVVSNLEVDGRKLGALGHGEVHWHTDSSFFEVPPAGSILRAVEVPEGGAGATSFLNMYLAWETLPEELAARVRGRRLNHSANYDSSGRPYPYAETGDPTRSPGARHPLVRTHPETGRRCLFLGRRLDAWIVGLSIAESEALLDALWAHAVQPGFAWTHRWRAGDVVMWDNRCVMHRREAFDPGLRRHLERTQLAGSRPE